jgi:hypothetical protein
MHEINYLDVAFAPFKGFASEGDPPEGCNGVRRRSPDPYPYPYPSLRRPPKGALRVGSGSGGSGVRAGLGLAASIDNLFHALECYFYYPLKSLYGYTAYVVKPHLFKTIK